MYVWSPNLVKGVRNEVGSLFSPAFYTNSTNNYCVKSTIYQHFYVLVDQASLPPLRLHDLRHSAATILLAMGVNIQVVQEILGHSNGSLTLKVYGHVLPGMQEEAMKKWGNVLSDG